MTNITIELEKTRLLIPLVRELWPHHGMGFTYTITPSTDLQLTRHRFSGVLKKFKNDHTVMTVTLDTKGASTGRFKVFVSVPGKKRNQAYYGTVEAYLQAHLCKPIEKSPEKAEVIIQALFA